MIFASGSLCSKFFIPPRCIILYFHGFYLLVRIICKIAIIRKNNPVPLDLGMNQRMPKYKQIVNSIINDIEKGVYKKDDQLLSITELSIDQLLSRDTVEKAYRELKARGYIDAVQGKGYFVKSKREQKIKVLLILNKLSSYKKIVYYAFLEALGSKATVDLQVHNYDPETFEEILEKNLGRYNYYVIMPHFSKDTPPAQYLDLLKKIPADELILLDRQIPELKSRSSCIYQDFEKDIFNVLEEHLNCLRKYRQLRLIFPKQGNYPEDIVRGFVSFCQLNDFELRVEDTIRPPVTDFTPCTAYIVIEESDLAELIKFSRAGGLTPGQDIGLISFNETTLKEVLGITVITTDFEAMGRAAAESLLSKTTVNIRNPFHLIDRGSV